MIECCHRNLKPIIIVAMNTGKTLTDIKKGFHTALRKAVHVLDRLTEGNKNGYVLGTISRNEARLNCPKSLKNKLRPEGIEPSAH